MPDSANPVDAALRLTQLIPGLYVGMPIAEAMILIAAEVERLRGIISQVSHDIGEEGYAKWSLEIHREIHGE